MLEAEVIETLLYGCVTWALSAKYFARLRRVHRQVLLRVTGFQRRKRTDYITLSYAKALEKTRCESIAIPPSASGGFSLREPWRGKTRGDYPVG